MASIVSKKDLQEHEESLMGNDTHELHNDGGIRTVISKDDPRYEAAIKGQFCGNCRHHKITEAQQAMVQERFLERLVHEEEWKLEWLKDWGKAGMCDHFEGRLIAWENPIVIARSDVDSTVAVGSVEGMERRSCPYFVSKAEKGGMIISTKHGVRRDRHE